MYFSKDYSIEKIYLTFHVKTDKIVSRRFNQFLQVSRNIMWKMWYNFYILNEKRVSI